MFEQNASQSFTDVDTEAKQWLDRSMRKAKTRISNLEQSNNEQIGNILVELKNIFADHAVLLNWHSAMIRSVI